VRDRLTYDDIERLEASTPTPKAHREAAARLVAWSEDRHPQDVVTPADLVSAAAWHLDQAGDVDAALDLHRRAVTAEGTTTPDARCMLAAALFDAGRPEEAKQVADDLRRSRPRVIDIGSMAEVFELAGDLQQAHRWTAMGLSRLELVTDEDELEEFDVEQLLRTRRRIREALGYPPDEHDEPEG
jgi:predicted MarR family transcription regulator